MPRSSALLLVALALAVGGCGGAAPTPSADGAAAAYRAGEPAFVLDAVARVRSGAPGVEVALGLPPASVAFRQTPDTLRALASWTVTLEREGGAPVTRTPVDTLLAPDPEAARSAEPRWRVERFDVPPGAYVVRAVVVDEGSNRTAERRQRVVVPAPDAGPVLLGLRLVQSQPTGSRPVDTGAIPARTDSLRALAQALDVPAGASAELRVVRLRVDTTVARRITDPSPPRESLAARGLDASAADTVHRARLPLDGPAEAADLGAPLPALGPGVFRVELDLRGPGGERLGTGDRLVVVRRRDYPRVVRLGDLIGPLEYLASAEAVADLRAAPTATARRLAFDRFWGERLDDRRVAAATLRAYYERVEEANRLFATFKEGWKTDRGMAFVLFGPPRFVQQTLDGERWTYGGGGTLPLVLDFELTAGGRVDASPFEVYTLRRGRGYEDAWRSARRQWRSGVVP